MAYLGIIEVDYHDEKTLLIKTQTFVCYAGLGLNELRELRQLRDENAKLKRLVADLSLDRHCLQWVQQVHRLSQRRVAGLIPVDRMTLRYLHHRDPQEALRVRLRELAGSRVRYGYRRLTLLLRREGWEVNAKRIYRLYAEEGLIVRTQKRRERAQRQRIPLGQAGRPNQKWSMDFVAQRSRAFDGDVCGQRFGRAHAAGSAAWRGAQGVGRRRLPGPDQGDPARPRPRLRT
jgi:putative transposase